MIELKALEFTFDIGAGAFEWFPYHIDHMQRNTSISIGLMLWCYGITRL